jgi:hypothetical protein
MVIPQAVSTFMLTAHVLKQHPLSLECSITLPQISHFCQQHAIIKILLQWSANSMETNFLISCTALWPITSCATISLTSTLQSSLISTLTPCLSYITVVGFVQLVRQTSDAHVAITVPYAVGTRFFTPTFMAQVMLFSFIKKSNTSTLAQWNIFDNHFDAHVLNLYFRLKVQDDTTTHIVPSLQYITVMCTWLYSWFSICHHADHRKSVPNNVTGEKSGNLKIVAMVRFNETEKQVSQSYLKHDTFSHSPLH